MDYKQAQILIKSLAKNLTPEKLVQLDEQLSKIGLNDQYYDYLAGLIGVSKQDLIQRIEHLRSVVKSAIPEYNAYIDKMPPHRLFLFVGVVVGIWAAKELRNILDKLETKETTQTEQYVDLETELMSVFREQAIHIKHINQNTVALEISDLPYIVAPFGIVSIYVIPILIYRHVINKIEKALKKKEELEPAELADLLLLLQTVEVVVGNAVTLGLLLLVGFYIYKEWTEPESIELGKAFLAVIGAELVKIVLGWVLAYHRYKLDTMLDKITWQINMKETLKHPQSSFDKLEKAIKQFKELVNKKGRKIVIPKSLLKLFA